MSSSSGDDTVATKVTIRERRNPKAAIDVKPAVATTSLPSPVPRQIQLAPFWPEKPTLWFAQIEGQFAINQISDDATKFYLVFASLDRKYAAEVEDVLTGPADYQRLKSELVKRLSVSRENKVKQLLMHEQLGDRKPSQFLRHLQHLAGADIPEDFIKSIWLSRLPSSLQPIVVSQTLLPLDALAELADRVNVINLILREDALRGSLQPAYTGPYEVLKRRDKFFTISVKNRSVTVSIDRLKPAYLLSTSTESESPHSSSFSDTSKLTTPLTSTTKSGRVVRFPDYYRP